MVNGALNGKTIILTLQNYNILGTLSSLSLIFFRWRLKTRSNQASLPARAPCALSNINNSFSFFFRGCRGWFFFFDFLGFLPLNAQSLVRIIT